MNRHEDFRSNSTCERCHPDAFKREQDKLKYEATSLTERLSDRQLQYAYNLRMADHTKKRIAGLKGQMAVAQKKVDDFLQQIEALELELKSVEDPWL